MTLASNKNPLKPNINGSEYNVNRVIDAPTSHPSISQQNKQNFHSIVSKECGHCTFKSVVFGWALP